jgi:iron(III) transport system substrate-binding protein
MARAVEQGDILLAYNVQLSYANAAQLANPNVGVIVPADYQAVQTPSVMIPNKAEHVEIAREFIDFLLSPVGQRLDEIMLAPTNSRINVRFTPSDRILNQADVSVSLLRLQDRARHDALTSEWNQAVRPSPPPPANAAQGMLPRPALN